MSSLNQEILASELKNLKNRFFLDNAIEKKFVFKNFVEALGFILKLGIIAEKANHHPEIFNVYNKITIRLTTHDANGVTMKDINLAIQIDLL